MLVCGHQICIQCKQKCHLDYEQKKSHQNQILCEMCKKCTKITELRDSLALAEISQIFLRIQEELRAVAVK